MFDPQCIGLQAIEFGNQNPNKSGIKVFLNTSEGFRYAKNIKLQYFNLHVPYTPQIKPDR